LIDSSADQRSERGFRLSDETRCFRAHWFKVPTTTCSANACTRRRRTTSDQGRLRAHRDRGSSSAGRPNGPRRPLRGHPLPERSGTNVAVTVEIITSTIKSRSPPRDCRSWLPSSPSLVTKRARTTEQPRSKYRLTTGSTLLCRGSVTHVDYRRIPYILSLPGSVNSWVSVVSPRTCRLITRVQSGVARTGKQDQSAVT
jgi:hypothetical protein